MCVCVCVVVVVVVWGVGGGLSFFSNLAGHVAYQLNQLGGWLTITFLTA